MSRATTRGVDLYYEDTGEGRTFVWLHGLLNSIERSRRMGEAIDGLEAHGYRLLRFDARGHGKSGASHEQSDYTWDGHTEDMRTVLDRLGIERAIIGGGSMGAGVSLTLAMTCPDRIEKLVLLVPPPLADTIETAQQIFGGLASLIEQLGVERAAEVVLGLPEYQQMQEHDPERYEQMAWWLRTLRSDTSVVAIRGLLFGPPLAAERFEEIVAPTLIVAQPNDPIHPLSSAERLHSAIAGSRLVVAPEFDYYRTHQQELLETIVDFLSAAH
jgi:pimeloyl-ACP methyl ester carboxylesterase